VSDSGDKKQPSSESDEQETKYVPFPPEVIRGSGAGREATVRVPDSKPVRDSATRLVQVPDETQQVPIQSRAEATSYLQKLSAALAGVPARTWLLLSLLVAALSATAIGLILTPETEMPPPAPRTPQVVLPRPRVAPSQVPEDITLESAEAHTRLAEATSALLETKAAELTAAGDYVRALGFYEQLSRENARRREFALMIRILQKKTAEPQP